ncbi:hypothetical protein BGZ58_001578 [Dissophora ornata]|nr:hypothetical protein BGZ58_001578 [Dissophora ornata]
MAGLPKLSHEKTWMEQHNGSEALFSYHPDDFVIGIPYDDKTTHPFAIDEAMESRFQSPSALAIYYTTKCNYVSFPSAEARAQALTQPLVIDDYSLPVFPVIRSVRHDLLHKLFKDCGKIIHFTTRCNNKSKLNRAYSRFVLELLPEAPSDFLLPRVAAIKGCNVLFSWSGSNFCYRCGKGDHLKAQCPKPRDYLLHEQAALKEPIWGHAFPDPDAPLRLPRTKVDPTPLARVPASLDKQGPGHDAGKNGKKRNRNQGRPSLSISDAVTASDSDSGEKPLAKRGPGHHTKESNLAHAGGPIGMENSHSVADVGTSSASHR